MGLFYINKIICWYLLSYLEVLGIKKFEINLKDYFAYFKMRFYVFKVLFYSVKKKSLFSIVIIFIYFKYNCGVCVYWVC